MGDYDLTLGTLLIGIIFNTFLFGFVISQFINYYRAGFKDPLLIQCMVASLFLLDSFHSAALVWMAWEYCITGYGKPETLLIGLWPYTFTPISNSLASLLAQLFLGWRVYCLSGGKKWLYLIIIVLAVPACVLGLTAGSKAWVIKYVLEMSQLNALSTAWLVMQVSADIFVAGSLGILLARSKTGFKRMDTVVNRLIRGAIQTGLFAGIFSILDLITFLCWPETNLYGMFAIPIGRIYSNTLLDTLNTRTELRQQLNSSEAETGVLSAIRWKRSTHTTQPATGIAPLTDIQVQKDVVVLVDEDQEGSGHSYHVRKKGQGLWSPPSS